jgi:hypothetical protein
MHGPLNVKSMYVYYYITTILWTFLVGTSKVVTHLTMGQCMPPPHPSTHARTHTLHSGIHKQTIT